MGSSLIAGCARRAATEATIVAASSLRTVLPALLAAHREGRPSAAVVISYGSSGELERQVEAGAPIDGVIFVHTAPVDTLVQKGLADPGTRRVIASNRVVLIGPKGGPRATFATIDALPADAKIAVGDPSHVPAGMYAEQVLRRLGKWDAVRGRLVYGGDVSAVLAYVRRGEVRAGIVYATDAMGIADVEILDEPPPEIRPRIEVVAAAIARASMAAEASAFFDFLATARAQEILREHGFGPPP